MEFGIIGELVRAYHLRIEFHQEAMKSYNVMEYLYDPTLLR